MAFPVTPTVSHPALTLADILEKWREIKLTVNSPKKIAENKNETTTFSQKVSKFCRLPFERNRSKQIRLTIEAPKKLR
jgi:sRNA-binding carbon storage regulator CsrA